MDFWHSATMFTRPTALLSDLDNLFWIIYFGRVNKKLLSMASSVQKFAQTLTEKQLLTHQQDIYEVYDKFMSEWLRRS